MVLQVSGGALVGMKDSGGFWTDGPTCNAGNVAGGSRILQVIRDFRCK